MLGNPSDHVDFATIETKPKTITSNTTGLDFTISSATPPPRAENDMEKTLTSKKKSFNEESVRM